ncbi:MAG: LacI family DNA-binding transcriptional regulator [Brevinema sp.]
MKKTATIKDVALLADVSISTVSFVFNNPSRVGAETRAKVMEAAQKLRYFPNSSATALRGRSLNIAIITNCHYEHFEQNPTIMETFPFITKTLTELGYYSMPFFVESNTPSLQLTSIIENNNIAGALVIAPRNDLSLVDLLISYEIPVSVIGTIPEYLDKVFCVDNDNERDIFNAVSLAYESGRKKVAYISGDLDYLVCQQRLKGYYEGIKKNNQHPPLIMGFGETLEEVDEMVKTTFRESQIDCIIAKDDIKAIYAIDALKKMGISVGKDKEVGIIGVGGIHMGALITPALSTMHFSMLSMIEKALDHLNTCIIDKEIIPGHLLISTEFYRRDSF